MASRDSPLHVPASLRSRNAAQEAEEYVYEKGAPDDLDEHAPLKHEERSTSYLASEKGRGLGHYPKTRRMGTGGSKFWSIRTYIPVMAIGVHTGYLVFLYVFYVVTFLKPVALPEKSAIWAKENDQAVTFIVTILSTLIAYPATSYFSGAIRYALARFMCGPGPVPLNVITASVTIANGGLLLPGRRWWWTTGSVLIWITIGAQTASWSTLLTPRNVPVTAKLSGTELDLSSQGFAKLMAANEALVPELFGNSLGLVTQSGSAAVSTQFSLPSILNFNSMSYFNSTGGSLPATWGAWRSTVSTSSGIAIPGTLTFSELSANIETKGRKVFPVSFQMTQQGFTTRVECKAVPLTETSSPSVQISALQDVTSLGQSLAGGGQGLSVGAGLMTVGCTGEGYTRLNYDGTPSGEKSNSTKSEPVLMNTQRDAVYGASCSVGEANGGAHWDLILVGTGKYQFMGSSICSVWPLTTSLDVDYQDTLGSFNSSLPSFINSTREWNKKPSPWLGQFAVDMFLRGVVSQGQSTRGSAVGDVVSEFVGTGVAGEDLTKSADKVPRVLEAYVRGVMEFSVTLLRTVYSAENSTLFAASGTTIPPELRIPMNGTYKTETMGWYQESQGQAAITTLIAPTLVALASIFLVLFSRWWTTRPSWLSGPWKDVLTDQEKRAHTWFDPGDLLHVITASRAGGLASLDFPALEDDVEGWADGVGLRVAGVGEGVGFVVK
ncbi:hypothetical protein D9611_010398 [Ephemerocybe angulata]|uniref:Uncharacterized protein n=1 Tax=Ephemerocybe angulata TaxID=980116 RepID=A0A8H5BV54_9AGAR|nr:hypothetical protein D9611_010398 [Tulosesus angulatus]